MVTLRGDFSIQFLMFLNGTKVVYYKEVGFNCRKEGESGLLRVKCELLQRNNFGL